MTFEEKAQIEIIKMAMNPKKRSSLIGGFDAVRGKLVYTDNGLQIFTIDNYAIYIDIDKCFPEANTSITELLYTKEPYGDLAVPTLQLRETVDGRMVEEFQTVEGQPGQCGWEENCFHGSNSLNRMSWVNICCTLKISRASDMARS